MPNTTFIGGYFLRTRRLLLLLPLTLPKDQPHLTSALIPMVTPPNPAAMFTWPPKWISSLGLMSLDFKVNTKKVKLVECVRQSLINVTEEIPGDAVRIVT